MGQGRILIILLEVISNVELKVALDFYTCATDLRWHCALKETLRGLVSSAILCAGKSQTRS